MTGPTVPAAPALVPLRWWHLPAVLRLERLLFAPDDWSVETLWSELAQRETRHYLAAVGGGGEVLGYVGLAAAPAAPGEAFVQTIGVDPAYQRRGLGELLLRALLAEAAARGATSVVLEVRTDNDAAQRLYRRAGFVPSGLRRGYYQPSGGDALVMIAPCPDKPRPGR